METINNLNLEIESQKKEFEILLNKYQNENALNLKNKEKINNLNTDNIKLSKTLTLVQEEINKTQINLKKLVIEQENKNTELIKHHNIKIEEVSNKLLCTVN